MKRFLIGLCGLLLVAGLGHGPAQAQSQQLTQCVTNALAGGTGDAITVPLLPCGTATNILLLTLTATNTTTAPTIQMPGFPALPIKTSTGTSVGIGALSAGAVVQLTGTGSSWLLLTSPTGNIANLNVGNGLTTFAGTLTLATQGCTTGQFAIGITLGTLNCSTPPGGLGYVLNVAALTGNDWATNVSTGLSLQGYYSAGDGGGGVFRNVSCTPDTGTCFQDSAGRFWKRDTNGLAWTPKWFGAKCDGVTDDLTAQNTFYADVLSGALVILPPTLCKASDTINMNVPVTILCPSGGGWDLSGIPDSSFGLLIRTSNFTISGGQGCLLNGPRTPLTGADYVVHNRGMEILGTSGSYLANVSVTGVTITNWKDSGIYAQYVKNSNFSNNNIQYVSWGGVVEQGVSYVHADNNYILWVASSNGPGCDTVPLGTKCNAYGISFTDDGFGRRSIYSSACGNVIDEVPTWHGLDSHAGQGITFCNNKTTNVASGVYITTDGVSLSAIDVDILGNQVTCAALNSPVYPGGPSSSNGAAGIFAGGASTSNLANRVKISDNTVTNCGSSENSATLYGGLTVSNIQNIDLSHNFCVAGRYRCILSYNEMLGAFTGNEFTSLSAGPLASGNILIDIEGASSQLVLSQHSGNSSGSEGYKIVPQGGSFGVGIARDNQFFGLSSLYDGSSASNRTDLGATAP